MLTIHWLTNKFEFIVFVEHCHISNILSPECIEQREVQLDFFMAFDGVWQIVDYVKRLHGSEGNGLLDKSNAMQWVNGESIQVPRGYCIRYLLDQFGLARGWKR